MVLVNQSGLVFQQGLADSRELAEQLKSHHSIRRTHFFIDGSTKRWNGRRQICGNAALNT